MTQTSWNIEVPEGTDLEDLKDIFNNYSCYVVSPEPLAHDEEAHTEFYAVEGPDDLDKKKWPDGIKVLPVYPPDFING